MQDYISAQWRHVFRHNGLNSFDDFWNYQAAWFEEPNKRRGGWSGVMRVELQSPDEKEYVIFLKRQENHVTKTLWNPLKGRLTFETEMNSIMHMRECGIPTLEPVYFAQRSIDGDRRCVLVTAELKDYLSLGDLTRYWDDTGWPDVSGRKKVIARVANVMRDMHDYGIQHNCFYSKHILLKNIENEIDVRVIDLEKVKRRWVRSKAALRDLYTLNRHLDNSWSLTDKMRFLLAYLRQQRLSAGAKRIWRKVASRIIRKQKLSS